MKKYRVNSSENFNLLSMYEHLKCIEIDMRNGDTDWDNNILDRIEEVESLMEKAPYVGSLVDWNTLKRIREIKVERQFIRYKNCLKAGSTEKEAGYSFTV